MVITNSPETNLTITKGVSYPVYVNVRTTYGEHTFNTIKYVGERDTLAEAIALGSEWDEGYGFNVHAYRAGDALDSEHPVYTH